MAHSVGIGATTGLAVACLATSATAEIRPAPEVEQVIALYGCEVGADWLVMAGDAQAQPGLSPGDRFILLNATVDGTDFDWSLATTGGHAQPETQALGRTLAQDGGDRRIGDWSRRRADTLPIADLRLFESGAVEVTLRSETVFVTWPGTCRALPQ
jgi:hypothetical protein